MNKKVTVINDAVVALLEFASDNPTRQVLNGIFIGDEHCVATDGAILGQTERQVLRSDELPNPLGSMEPGYTGTIVPSEAVRDAKKTLRKGNGLPVLNDLYLFKGTIASTDLDSTHQTSFKPIEGTYPKYAQVFPKADGHNVVKAVISVKNLEKLVRASKRIKATSVELEVIEDEKGKATLSLIKAELRSFTADALKITAIVVPMRVD